MITLNDFRTYCSISDDIQYTAKHVASYFKQLDVSFQYAIDEPGEWEIEIYDGIPRIERWNLGPYCDDSCSFEAKWLWATDEELQQHVEDVLEERELEIERRKQELAAEEERRKQAKIERNARLLKMTREELLKELGVEYQ